MAWYWPFGRSRERSQDIDPGSVVAKTIPVFMQGRSLPSTYDFDNFFEEGYRRNAVIHTCANEIATSVAEPELLVEVMAEGEWVAVKDDGSERAPGPALRLHRLLKRPNREQGQYEWLELMLLQVKVAGNSFTHKVRSNASLPAELWQLSPERIEIIPGGDGLVEQYKLQIGGGQHVTIPAMDVMHIKQPDLKDQYWGLSSVVPAAGAGDLDNQAIDYTRAFFKNAGAPAGLLKLKDKAKDPERKRLQQLWRERMTGNDGWHSISVLDADVEFQEVGSRPDKLKLDFVFDSTESRICSSFGVPPVIVGVRLGLIRSTFANYREARRSFWRETLAPLYRRISDKMTEFIAAEFGTGIRVRFELSGIEELQESQESKRDFAMMAWDKGVITRNEAREVLDYEEVDGGDVFKKRMAETFIAPGEQEQLPNLPPDPDPDNLPGPPRVIQGEGPPKGKAIH